MARRSQQFIDRCLELPGKRSVVRQIAHLAMLALVLLAPGCAAAKPEECKALLALDSPVACVAPALTLMIVAAAIGAGILIYTLATDIVIRIRRPRLIYDRDTLPRLHQGRFSIIALVVASALPIMALASWQERQDKEGDLPNPQTVNTQQVFVSQTAPMPREDIEVFDCGGASNVPEPMYATLVKRPADLCIPVYFPYGESEPFAFLPVPKDWQPEAVDEAWFRSVLTTKRKEMAARLSINEKDIELEIITFASREKGSDYEKNCTLSRDRNVTLIRQITPLPVAQGRGVKSQSLGILAFDDGVASGEKAKLREPYLRRGEIRFYRSGLNAADTFLLPAGSDLGCAPMMLPAKSSE